MIKGIVKNCHCGRSKKKKQNRCRQDSSGEEAIDVYHQVLFKNLLT